ncbi:MAG: DUF2283 domain-containing protein [Chloroflexi bacterium]|nr:DUF2283 domain-containing protein [Chloroflexota bacterium]MBU1752000.1 DUF2283 domain-containing protein [Chloroflexota bacterium]
MKVTYDRSVDAAYIYLVDAIAPGSVETTYSCDPLEIGGIIALDFDAEGRLVGIEVLGASKRLPSVLLDEAEIIG